MEISEFITVLASKEPAPGGGGAAALVGAIGTALGNMVGALTVGKKKYAAVEDEIRSLMAECDCLQAALLAQIDADAEGFLPLAKAYALPKDTPNREKILDDATVTACTAPMRIMELCCKALDAVAVFAEKGSRLALSDAGCAAVTMKAALQAASLNVLINTKSLSDRKTAEELNVKCLDMLKTYESKADCIYEVVKNSFLP